jgi:hypothetical protein
MVSLCELLEAKLAFLVRRKRAERRLAAAVADCPAKRVAVPSLRGPMLP